MPGFWVGQVPGSPVAIHVSLDVIDRLHQDVMDGYAAVPRRGAEVGGILFGNARSDGRVVVDDYRLVAIEHRFGPSFRLSEKDAVSFERAASDSRAIGYFRSHTRDGQGLSDEDLALLAKFFPQAEAPALLIRPFAAKAPIARFYARRNGVFLPDTPALEFPLRRKDLAPARSATPPLDSRTVPASQVIAAAPVHRSRWWPVLLLGLILLIGWVLGYGSALTFFRSDPYNIGLSVNRSSGVCQVNWNARAAAVHAAQRGLLTIFDGPRTTSIALTAADLRAGRGYRYQAIHGRVVFRLQVFGNPRSIVAEIFESQARDEAAGKP